MENPYIDLRNCEQGDLLVLKDGSLAQYVEHMEGEYYPHLISYCSDGKRGGGTRNDDGSVFKNNKRPDDYDIVLIFPKEMNIKSFRNKLLKNKNEKRN